MAYRMNPVEDVETLRHRGQGHGPKREHGGEEDSTLLIDATMKGDMPPLALPKREFMERARAIWDELGLPGAAPAAAVVRLFAGRLAAANGTRPPRAPSPGDYLENGRISAKQRRKGVTPETKFRPDEASADRRRRMKLGFFTMPVHPKGRDYGETLKEDREAFILADKLGYTEAYCGEHLTDECENIPNSMMFIATPGGRDARTSSSAPRSPTCRSAIRVVVASNAAMLDNLLEGRLILGFGAGILRSDAEAMELLDEDRGAMFVEALDQVIALWTGDAPYEHHRQILEHHHREDAVARDGRRRHGEALSEAASADHGHGDRPELARHRGARPARLSSRRRRPISTPTG